MFRIPADRPATFSWRTLGVEFRDTIQGSTGTYTALSGHGAPGQFMQGNWIGLPSHMARADLPFQIPALVLFRELQNLNYTLQYVGTATINGQQAVQIHVCDNSDSVGALVTPQDWYFDPASYLPLRVEYRLPDQANPQSWLPLAMDFGNFQAVSGALVPYAVKIELGTAYGSISTTATVTSAAMNSGLSPGTFDAPAGGGQ